MATLTRHSKHSDSQCDVVFLDTNLDTHLALLVSHLDTVSDLKKKILSEHPQCFPKIGQIQIHAVKVKRKGYFYHLSDSLLVRSAFNGFDKSWFLSVDASAMADHGQNQQPLLSGSPDQVACLATANNALICPVDDATNTPPKKALSLSLDNFQLPQLENKHHEKEENHFVSPCASEHTGNEVVKILKTGVKSSGNNDTGIPLHGSVTEMHDHSYVNHELQSSPMECDEEPAISLPSSKRKRKSKRKKENTVQGSASKENIASVDNTLSSPSKRVCSFNNSRVLQLENKQDGKEEISVVSPCVSEHTARDVVNNVETVVKSSGNVETAVKSSGNNGPDIPLPGSVPEVEDHCHVNHECPSLHIECEVDGSSKGVTKYDRNVCEEEPSISVPNSKKKRKSKRKKENIVQDDTSKENIASVDNHLSSPSKRASSVNNFQVPQLENKQEDKEEISVVSLCVSEHTGKEAVKNVETGVKSSGNNDPVIPFPGLALEIEDHCHVNNELPSSHVECDMDGSTKNIKDTCTEHEESNSKAVLNAKKKQKSKRKREDTVQDDTSKENTASVVGLGSDTVQQDVVVLANPSENANKEATKETEVLMEQQRTDYNIKNDIDVGSMKEASEPVPPANKKHKKRNRSLTYDTKDVLKVETASQKGEEKKSEEAHKDSKEPKDQCEFDNDKSREDLQYNKHNKVTEDVLDTRPPAKRKQKGKVKSGDKSFSKDSTSHCLLEDQQKTKNSGGDQSSEHFPDTDHLRSSVIGGKRKGKKNSSHPHETPVVTSSKKDYEADHSSIRGEGVQEEISVDGLFSKDISMNKTTLDNMEIGTDACKEGIGSELNPSGVNEPRELTEGNVNIVLDHSHISQAGQSEGAEEGREVSPENDLKPILLKKHLPSNQDNTDADIKELNVTSKILDENGITEPVKSEKKKRGIRKVKDSDGGAALREGIDASENETSIIKSPEAENCDPISGNTETEENLLNQAEGKNIPQEEMKGTLVSATDKENGSTDHVASLEQIKTKANAEHVDELSDKRHRKKPNNKQTSISKSGSNSATLSIGENRKTHAKASGKSMDLEKRRGMSNSKQEGSSKKVQYRAGKASGYNVKGIVNSTQQKKSLLEGAIFKDESSATSEDEDKDKVDNSDASTRTPSDNSLLSDFSDGDSSADSHGGKSPENGGISALKASLSGTKEMSIDRILRSSSRYKKARVTASQLEETESQPEFVPDSLADM